MNGFDPKARARRPAATGRHLCATLALTALLAGCDNLLDVTMPGQLLEESLDNPQLAAVLARGAESDFECAFGAYLVVTGLWTSDFWYTDRSLEEQRWNQRNVAVPTLPEQNCTGLSIWRPLNVARVQGEVAAERLSGWSDEQVANRDYLLAQANAYAGYSYLLMGEAMCELTFDAGPLETREAAWGRAVAALEDALTHAGASNHAEASSIANMARVGLARAHLNLGDGGKVVEYASAVPLSFVRTVSASESTSRRYNRLFVLSGSSPILSVASSYLDLTVGGVPDPRVPVLDGGGPTGFDGLTPVWYQQKYLSRSSPMPFASGREAQLMIAEVRGGAEAVGIINALRATHDLPPFTSNDPAAIRAQVLEERRRELWLQGTRLGDMLRHDIEFPTGELPRGSLYGPLTCMPLPDEERNGNENA